MLVRRLINIDYDVDNPTKLQAVRDRFLLRIRAVCGKLRLSGGMGQILHELLLVSNRAESNPFANPATVAAMPLVL
jgi:hypothetical protein